MLEQHQSYMTCESSTCAACSCSSTCHNKLQARRQASTFHRAHYESDQCWVIIKPHPFSSGKEEVLAANVSSRAHATKAQWWRRGACIPSP
mmetsp:Transcript_12482/g.26425  ORF Transcript_12482/g.26425 Transcript_12482/m.26425 type:complete len:91 (+) Transcript_12482:213-485(+)